MLQFIKDLPDHVVGIRATGEVDKEDYEKILIPRIEELAARQGEINYLLVLETDVQNFSAAAWWQDFRLGLKHFGQLKKVAIVTDQKSVQWITDTVSHFIPGESHAFSLYEIDKAIEWVSEDDDHTEPADISVDELRSENTMRSSNKNQGPAGENL